MCRNNRKTWLALAWMISSPCISIMQTEVGGISNLWIIYKVSKYPHAKQENHQKGTWVKPDVCTRELWSVDIAQRCSYAAMNWGEADFLKILVNQVPNNLLKMYWTIGYICNTVNLKIFDQFKFLMEKCNNIFVVFILLLF